jgi:hypothetical protein
VTQRLYGLTRLLGHGYAFTEEVAVPTPAAGAASFTYTPANYWEVIDSLTFKLVTDNNAANRQVTLTVKDGEGVALAVYPAASVQAASNTYTYSFLAELSNFNTVVGGVVTSPVFPSLIRPGWSVVVSIGAVQVGDQASNIRFVLERFVTGNAGYLLGVVEEDTGLDAFVRLETLAS